MYNGTFQVDQPAFKNYRLEAGNTTSDDYLNWPYLPAPSGQRAAADTLGNPLVQGDLTLWSVYNDADLRQATNVAPAARSRCLEIQQTTFAFARGGALGNIIFLKFRIINKGVNNLDSTYISIWADPDLGDASDDLVGCDTTLSLGYCYNETDNDAVYGSAPRRSDSISSVDRSCRYRRASTTPGNDLVQQVHQRRGPDQRDGGLSPDAGAQARRLPAACERRSAPADDDVPVPGRSGHEHGWLDGGGNDRRLQLSRVHSRWRWGIRRTSSARSSSARAPTG